MAKTSFFTDSGPTPSVLSALESSVNAAAASEANAATSETNAAASAVSALASKNSANTDAATATTKASEASTSATSAATSLSNIGSSETNAATSATNAANSATAAAGSATTASGHATTATTQASTATTKASEASTSATNAATSATTASTQASTATTKASEAATSATNAASSATTASTGASTATTQATNAATSASTASTQATNASNSATAAATSATNAATSATASETAKTASVAAKDAALAALDSFDDRYLGTKSSDPSVDNDGDALVSGALYYNTSTNVMMVYSGSAWLAAYASLSGTLTAANNLSDLANAATARTNLGLGSIATSATSAFLASTGGTVSGILNFSGTDHLKIPVGTTAQRAGSPAAGMFRYNSTDNKFEGYTDEWGELGGGSADLTKNTFTGNNSTTAFTLSAAAVEDNCFVFLDGVYQAKANFTVSSANPAVVTFSTAPPTGVAIEIMVAAISATVIGTPSDNTVSTAKLQDDAVTTAKIADDAITSALIADDAITSALIADDAVVAAAIADNAVDIARLNVSDGSSGQVLTTNGAGTLSFATVGGAYNTWLVKTSAYTALVGDQIIVNNSSAVTITLPASASAGNTVIVKATGGGTVTLGRNSQNINSQAADGTLFSGNSVQLVYVDGTIGFLEI